MATQRKYLVIGGGAVGSLFGWRLQQGGASVSVVCRSNYATVAASGYHINSVKYGKSVFTPDHVYATPLDAVKDGQVYEFVLVCTKSLPNLQNPAEVVEPVIIDKHTSIVLLQNGIGIETYFADIFPENPIMTSVVYVDVAQSEHGLINHGSTAKLEYGLYETEKSDMARDQEMLHQLDADLIAGGALSTIASNIQRLRWTKLVWNATFNPICVVSGGYNPNELIANPLAKDMIAKAMAEVLVLAEAVTNEKAELIFSDKTGPVTNDEFIAAMFYVTQDRPNPIIPSMLLDYMHKRPMEHEVILKNPIELAKKFNVEVPILETIYALLTMLEKKNLA